MWPSHLPLVETASAHTSAHWQTWLTIDVVRKPVYSNSMQPNQYHVDRKRSTALNCKKGKTSILRKNKLAIDHNTLCFNILKGIPIRVWSTFKYTCAKTMDTDSLKLYGSFPVPRKTALCKSGVG